MLPLAWSASARAELDWVPYGGVQVEHQSNLFETEDTDEALRQNGDPQRDDNVLRYIVGVGARYRAGLQTFNLDLEGRRLEYEHFTEIDHDEHAIDGEWLWKVGSQVDGFLRYHQERRVASFADLNISDLTQQFDRSLEGNAGWLMTPRWRLEAGGRGYRSELPLPNYPEFMLQENAGTLALKYLGLARLRAGVLGEYIDGEYTGDNNEMKFDEVSMLLTLDYDIANFSTTSLRVGFSDRDLTLLDATDPANRHDEVSGFTGEFSYTRIFSVKTSASLQAFRRIDSFASGSNAIIDTGVGAALNWRITPKTTMVASYTYSQNKFDAQGGEQARRDDLQLAGVDLRYELLNWLWVRPYWQYRDRDSNTDDQSFINHIVGAELRAHFGRPLS